MKYQIAFFDLTLGLVFMELMDTRSEKRIEKDFKNSFHRYTNKDTIFTDASLVLDQNDAFFGDKNVYFERSSGLMEFFNGCKIMWASKEFAKNSKFTFNGMGYLCAKFGSWDAMIDAMTAQIEVDDILEEDYYGYVDSEEFHYKPTSMWNIDNVVQKIYEDSTGVAMRLWGDDIDRLFNFHSTNPSLHKTCFGKVMVVWNQLVFGKIRRLRNDFALSVNRMSEIDRVKLSTRHKAGHQFEVTPFELNKKDPNADTLYPPKKVSIVSVTFLGFEEKEEGEIVDMFRLVDSDGNTMDWTEVQRAYVHRKIGDDMYWGAFKEIKKHL